MDLEVWLTRNRDRLGSEYEELFVTKVLSLVRSLDPRTVSAQFHFLDDSGGNRYCDFVIREGGDLRIAIEVDGYDKRGTGQGMTRSEWVDWQRRHASLVSQGWNVIRFANADVRDHPDRCAEHLRLLLQRERAKADHARHLKEQIDALERERAREKLKVAEERGAYAASGPVAGANDREQELEKLRLALERAKQSSDLTEEERRRLADLEEAQRKVQGLEKETNIMKTTIWALTGLMALLLVLFFMGRTPSGQPPPPSQAIVEQPAQARPEPVAVPADPPPSLAGSSCTHPLPWQEARNRIGETVAVAGPVVRVAEPDGVRGQPVFITIGRSFPSRDRLDVVIWGNRRSEFSDALAQDLQGRDLCLLSEVGQRDGVPQMVLRDRRELQVR